MNGRVSAWLTAFHRDEGGQIGYLAVFGAVLVVAMIALVANTGVQTAAKVQLQNAVDSGTLSAAGWYARGLNITSGLSVVQTQLLAAALLIDALASSADIVDPLLPELLVAYTEACVLGGGILTAAACVCAAQIQFVSIPTFRVIGIPLGVLAQEFASHPGGILWRIMRLLGTFNRTTHYLFNWGFLIAAGNAVAAQTAAPMDLYYFPIPGGWFHGERQVLLPTKKAPDMAGLCNAANNGSPGFQHLLDYPAGWGPLGLGRSRLTWLTTAIAGCAAWPVLFRMILWGKEWGACPGGGVEVWELDSADQKLLLFGMARASDPPRRFRGGGFFREPPTKTAWAEAEIYNGIALDSFSQDWRVRLRPVSLPWQHLQKLQETPFAGLFHRLTGTPLGSFEVLSNH